MLMLPIVHAYCILFSVSTFEVVAFIEQWFMIFHFLFKCQYSYLLNTSSLLPTFVRLPPWYKPYIVVYITFSSFEFWNYNHASYTYHLCFLWLKLTFNKFSLLLDLVSVSMPMAELFLVETWPHASYICDIWCIELVSICCVSSSLVICTSSMTLS
jgi:hypothetical protein